MAEQQDKPTSPAPPPRKPPNAAEPAAPKRPRAWFARISELVRQLGADAASVALGRLVESAAPSRQNDQPASASDAQDEREVAQKRIHMLHEVAERLRGAADNYIAVKLDEIEARVDTKLDEIEQRIDDKIDALHTQLRAMRDQELRHRLRLLKLTLIFTVLVALLSLGYKWVSIVLANGSN